MRRAAQTGRGEAGDSLLFEVVVTLVPVTVGIVVPTKVGIVAICEACEACVGEVRHDLGFIVTAPIGADIAGFDRVRNVALHLLHNSHIGLVSYISFTTN